MTRPTPDELAAAREELHKAIGRFFTLAHPGEYVTAWVLATEYTDIRLTQENKAGRAITAPVDQPISATLGLGSYIVGRLAK